MTRKICRQLLTALACAATFACCKQPHKEDVHQLAASFSELECRAFSLREHRYALADKIRFTEDSIGKAAIDPHQKKQLQVNLTGYLKEKDNTLAASLRLADSVKTRLDSIIKVELHDTSQTKLFDEALSAELKKRHCM